MAKAALKTVKRPEVRAFAERVVAARTAEIGAIDALLKKRMTGGTPQPEMETTTDDTSQPLDGTSYE